MALVNFTNPSSLEGVRDHRITLNQLQSEAFRSASQNQETTQAAEAFSGSQVTNTQTQVATLSQTATANNSKTVRIDAVTATNANEGSFNSNYLQRYTAAIDGSDFIARGSANVAQNQGAEQNATAKARELQRSRQRGTQYAHPERIRGSAV